MYYQKNGKLINNKIISMEDRAFMYGDGCFTTARWSNQTVQLWSRHLARFEDAFHRLAINCNTLRLQQEFEQFRSHIKDVDYGTIKILVSRGVSARGYALPDQDADIYMYFYPSTLQSQPILIDQIGILDEPLGEMMPRLKGVKTLNRLEQVMLKHAAQKKHWIEALCLDSQQNVVEAISSNCFIYLNEQWITPNLATTGIAGTMRAEILSRMADYQISHQVRMITVSELAQAEALFLCNALQPMQMINTLVNVQGNTQALALAPCQNLFARLSLSQLV